MVEPPLGKISEEGFGERGSETRYHTSRDLAVTPHISDCWSSSSERRLLVCLDSRQNAEEGGPEEPMSHVLLPPTR